MIDRIWNTENSSFRKFYLWRAIFLSSSGPISLVRLQYNTWYEGSEEKESELAKVGWLLRGRWVEKYLGSLEMQLLPRLPVTGRGTSLHHLTHYQVINLDSCWTCPAWLPRKWLHFKSKLTCAQCSGLPLNILNWKHFAISYFYIYTTICIDHYWYIVYLILSSATEV